MRIYFFGVLFFLATSAVSQKKIIDTSVFGKWPEVGGLQVSGDGNYVLYMIDKLPAGSQTLVLQATDNSWKQEYMGAIEGVLSSDGKRALFKRGDSLFITALGKPSQTVITGAINSRLLNLYGKPVLIYQQGKTMVIRDLSTEKEEEYKNVTGYWLSQDSRILAYQNVMEKEGQQRYGIFIRDMEKGATQLIYENNVAVQTVQLSSNGSSLIFVIPSTRGENKELHYYSSKEPGEKIIWNGAGASGYSFDATGGQLVFKTKKGIAWYKTGMEKALIKVDDHTRGIDNGLEVNKNGPVQFSRDGRRIIFQLIEKEHLKAPADVVGVDIWSYKDEHIQSKQLASLTRRNFYATIYDLSAERLIRIEQEGERARDRDLTMAKEYVLVLHQADIADEWWRPAQRSTVTVVSLKDGSRVFHNVINYGGDLVYDLSPGERYLVYYDPFVRSYCSYELSTRVTRRFAPGPGGMWESIAPAPIPDPQFGKNRHPAGLAGWLADDSRILLYDNDDLWSADPSGRTAPVNVTHGYGRLHHTKLRITNRADGRLVAGGYAWDYATDEELLLQGVDRQTKVVSLYRKKLNEAKSPSLLLKGPYMERSGLLVFKAAEAEVWVFTKSNPQDAPNYHATKDWKQFTRLSDLQPHVNYNWYASELVHWTLPNGEPCQGVLYQPEHLEPGKKYPLIFYYYEAADNPNRYMAPQFVTGCGINIPYFVSQGYLVFIPDMHYKIGHPGKSALEVVESAARLLSKRNYVDSKRMGLAGHSWGGFETNYIVTHSKLFAAAAEGAGMSDFISDYGSVSLGGASRQEIYEVSQSRIGATLWQRPDLYIENSPVLQADRVTNPLLMLHNRLDINVSWAQGVELFTALRRLNKPVWMLQYDGEGHGIINPSTQRDYFIRLTQFFDHYLKGAPPPRWMTEGIPAKLKGIDTGYELQPGKKP